MKKMRFLGILLGLVLLVGLMVGLSATAFASEPLTGIIYVNYCALYRG